MKRLSKVLVLGSAVALVAMLTNALPAGASPPTGYGFDNTAHLIVGGGSDTTYKAMVNLTDLYDGSVGCPVVTAQGANLNNCVIPSPNNPETNTLGNYQRDTVAQANPTGSSAGVTALINGATYNGAPGGINFARSSRGPKTGELNTTTFWGFAQDGIQVVVFNGRSSIATGADPVTNPKISPQDLHDIYTCTKTQWNQIAGLGITPGGPGDGPIVPWSMNSASGTYASFQTYIQNKTGDSGFDPDSGGACIRNVTGNLQPLENDIKPLVATPASLSTSPSSIDNPENWIWWGSWGELTAFSFKSSINRSGTQVTAFAAPVEGRTPNGTNIFDLSYPITRTVYHVTKNTDADCPQTVPGTCDFNGNPGPAIPSTAVNDLNVTGGSSGTSGAVREFTRFLCRQSSSQQALDPYTGINNNSGISTAINRAGFLVVPVSLRTSGSRCQVLT